MPAPTVSVGDAVLVADSDFVIEAAARLGTAPDWPFLAAGSSLLDGRARTFVEAIFNQTPYAGPSAAERDELAQYLALSSAAHVLDGWRYIAQSSMAFLSGSRTQALHLAYYAELRAGLAILAQSGIGILKGVASAYMLVMETIMLFTAIRFYWDLPDKNAVSDTLFIKDGPLTLRSQYSKLVPPIRAFFEYSKSEKRPVHVIGQEKTGVFAEHLASIVRFAAPHARGEEPAFAVLSHEYVRKEVYRAPNLVSPYGMRTNWAKNCT